MKKIYVFILLFVCVFTQAQKHTDRYYNSWRLGLNMGAMWQIADVRSTPGFAGGFTLEKGLCENKTNFFSLAIKGRGLWGNTYGLDYVRNYDIKNNPSLNGTYNPQVNYDTIRPGIGPYIHNNYKTKIAEGALELQICFNRLRERTNILLNLWAGIGFTSYRTSVNLLDKDGKMYNYRLVDSTSKVLTLSSHDFLLDDSYESYATNSKKGNVLTLSPSCGIGFGYRFNDHISILWEHKITFPQGTYSDYLDGIKASNNDRLGCVKDYYHYSSLSLNIRLGGKSKSKSTTNVNNYTPVHTNTAVTQQTNSVTTNPTNTVITQPVVAKPPIVNITNPPSSPYSETLNRNFPISADVFNVSQRSQLKVTFNGTEINDYAWNGKTIQFIGILQPGNNIVSVTATNSAGNDSKSAVIMYSGVPPQITITTPGTSKVISAQSTSEIYATILNVESSSFVAVKFNGQDSYSFSYNPIDKLFSMNVNLATGTNTVDITATNSFGKDFKSQLIIYKPVAVITPTAAKSVSVVITDPTVNPYKSASATYKVKAKVSGVNAASQVTVTANSAPVTFNYASGNVDFDVAISTGSALVQVSASNGRSSDSKSTLLTYEAPVKDVKTKVICHRKDRVTMETINILESDWAQHQAHGDYEGACQVEPVEVDNDIIICHKNADGSSQTITVKQSTWAQHQLHGDVMGTCVITQTITPIDRKITICHIPPGNNQNPQTIVINESAWPAHQAHGDTKGACPTPTVVPEDKKITICHIPPGNNQNPQTIEINESAWPAHQAHGDTKGACPKIITQDPIDAEITICHKNADGSKQTIIVKESTWPQHEAHGDTKGVCPKIIQTPVEIDPDMVICHKNGDGTETKMTIKQSQWAAHQAHGDYVGGTCAIQSNTATSTNTIEICHNNGDGSKTTMVIDMSQFSSHRAHGDLMGKCPPQATQTNTTPAGPGITICHKNGDGSTTTMIISADQWSVHRGHGDAMGTCPPPPEDKKIIICHIPPGNNQNPQTIEINESAWPAHQAHGDTKGACPEQKANPVKGKGEIKETDTNNDNGTKVPGRTTQPTTEEPQKTEVKKMTPR